MESVHIKNMSTKAGYFEDPKGNKSSGRILGFIVTLYALALSTAIVVLGYIEGTSVLTTAASAGTIFTTMAGPAMFFMFNNKKVEAKENEQLNNIIKNEQN